MKKIGLIRGLTLDDIYVICNRRIGQSKLSRIERVIILPSNEEKAWIARVLGEPVGEVFPDGEPDAPLLDFILMPNECLKLQVKETQARWRRK